MLFTEALSVLLEGKYVVRKSWNEEEGYIVFMPGMDLLWKIMYKPTPNAGAWMAKVSDMEADDWSILDKSKIDMVA